MTVVFVYKKPDFEILQYSLKGVERFVRFDDIYIVGDVPDWWQYKSIHTEPKENKFEDVYNKYQKIKSIDDDILLMYDDIFITNPYNPIHYYDGMLRDKKVSTERWQLMVRVLKNYPTIKDFNTHRPIPVRKEIFKRTVGMFDAPFSHDAFCFGYPTKQAKDCKIKKQFTYKKCKDMPMFSTYNEGEWLIPILSKVYN